MTIFDKKLRFVVAAFALVVSVHAGKPKPPGAPSVSREGEEDYLLGERFADGNGVPRNYIEAARYYRKAAVKGHVGAQYNLAWLLENGLGVRQDAQEAAA